MIQRKGLTRLEILLALVAALFAVGLVAMMISRQRENALRVQCRNNLKLLGEAFRRYHDASAADPALQRLPPARIADGYATWAVLLAPHLTKGNPAVEGFEHPLIGGKLGPPTHSAGISNCPISIKRTRRARRP